MDKLKSLQTDLKAAQDALTALQDELPQFHALLTDNEQEAARLRRERASLDDQAQAKSRVMVAREMLEQHQSDLASARAEVLRLEGTLQREVLLEQMAQEAKQARTHRQAQDRTITNAARALAKAVETIRAERASNQDARTAFFEAGEQLVPGFKTRRRHYDNTDAAITAASQALTTEAEAHGAPLDYALDNTNGQLGYLDETTTYLLPRGDFETFIHNAVAHLDRQEGVNQEQEKWNQLRNERSKQLLAAHGLGVKE